MSHVGIGRKGSVAMVTSATSAVMPTCSTRIPILRWLRQRLLQLWYIMTVMMKSLSSRLRPTSSRRRSTSTRSKTRRHTYVKKDFVKCTRKSQTDPKGHGKVGKTTEEIRKDDHWAYSCRLASSRGKAMAIVLDEKGEYRDIDEVLVIVVGLSWTF